MYKPMSKVMTEYKFLTHTYPSSSTDIDETRDLELPPIS